MSPVTEPTELKQRALLDAAIGVFARFCEIVAQHLNQVLNKNFLAFLDLLGTSRLPPQPARVPLTFTLVAGSSPSDTLVPAGTQCAAPPLEGEKPRRLRSIPGSPPSLFNIPKGCSFAPRCPSRFERCAEKPALEGGKHAAACFLTAAS